MLAIQMIGTTVLARLLTPQDFGLVTMVSTFSLLLANFGHNGFNEVILQRNEIDHVIASNIFWFSVATGVFFTVLVAASGSLIARFYGNPQVARITLGMSLTIVVMSTSVVHLALLRRAMQFSGIARNNILAQAISVFLSIVLALRGWGYWALVAAAVAQPLVISLGAWRLCRWLPGWPRRTAEMNSMVRFAFHVYGRFIVNYFSRNTDNLLVGWRFNAQALGFYKKAYDLFALSAGQLVTPLSSVAISALSRVNATSPEYKRYFRGVLSVLAFVGMGLGAVLTLVGKDLLLLLLGPGWEPAGRIFTYFGPGIGIMLVYYTHGWVHLSIGRADRWFRWGLVEVTVTILIFCLALPWGPAGIALGWTVSFWALTVPAFWYAGKPIQLGIGLLVEAIWKFVLAALLAGVACAAIIPWFPTITLSSVALEESARVVIASLLFGALYLAAVILLHRGLKPVYQLAGLAKDLLPRVRLARQSATMAASPGAAHNQT
jgi:PST family polysaccharide transporter